VAAYARGAGLRPKELPQWKTLLVRRGLLASTAAAVPTPDFVRVVAPAPASSLRIRLVLPNGVRRGCPALLESGVLATLIEAASRL
jgi:hypothetical protein